MRILRALRVHVPSAFALALPLILAASAAPSAAAKGAEGYYRQPDLHGDTIVFVAEGDLWTVPAQGGLAERLTSHPGDESHPVISPDGTRVAFVATYEGPSEVYVMPLAGGVPSRVTFEGAAIETVGWKDDERVLFSSRMRSTLPNVQLFSVNVKDATTPIVEPVPLWQASDGVFIPDGALVFTRLSFQGSHAKRYQGGTAQQLWRWDGGDAEAIGLTTDYPGTSRQPMWRDGRVWFATDRDGTMNLWSMTRDGGDLRQHTHHDGWDALSPSMDGSGRSGRVVYQLGADLRLFDGATGGDAIVPVTLRTDLDQMREQWVEKPQDYITSAHVSPDGSRVVITARGRIFVVPKKPGRLVEVDRDSGVRWRGARFVPSKEEKAADAGSEGGAGGATGDAARPADDESATPPDPGLLVALSDRSGEVEVWTLPANGVPLPPHEPRQRTSDGSVLRWFAVPSPDGNLVAHTDKDQRLWLLDLRSGENRQVTQSMLGDIDDVEWSPDSRWLTFTEPAGNLFRRITLCRVDDLSMTPLTSDRYDSYSACWSPEGDWIYFVSDRNLETIVTSPWGPYQPEPYMAKTGRLYALALRSDLRFPFLPPDELHPADRKEKKTPAKTPGDETKPEPPAPGDADAAPPAPGADGAAKAEGKADAKKDAKDAKPIEIELEGLAERLYQVPVPPGLHSALSTNGKILFWLSRDAVSGDRTLSAIEVENDERKVVDVAEKVSSYELSLDGSTLLIVRERRPHLVPAKAAAADLGKGAVDLAGWALSVIPREQWRQMFADAWRLHRDYFYDPAMHGVDWNAMREKYAPLVERVTTRAELSDVLAQMVSELSALHTSVRGGDLRRGPDQIRSASLGAELERDDAGWRVTRIYRTDPEDPAGAAPLDRPQSRVKVGEVIERINGVPTLSVADPSLLLRGTAERQVLLHVRGEGGGELRPVIVEPISTSAASSLRYDDWTITRREQVEKEGEGRIGYLHLRAMGEEDWPAWARGYYPVFNREGLIIDVRHNRGGNIDSWILNRLLRKAWFGWSTRVGQQPLWNMQFAFRGHVVVLCDEWTASDGEAFAEGIKRLDLGTLIGRRTWGGEIWLSGSNLLVDRGIASAAEFGVYGPDGIWLIEGHGVVPDIEVDNLPRETYAGRDRQLEAAIEFLRRKIAEEPIPPLTRPDFPRKVP